MSENPTSYLLREDMATANTAPLPRGQLVRQMPSRYSASCSGWIPAFASEGKIGSLAEILWKQGLPHPVLASWGTAKIQRSVCSCGGWNLSHSPRSPRL